MPRILVVEDNIVQAHTLRLLLTRLGHTLTGVVASAIEAEALFLADPPDLLLLDVRLHGGDDGIVLGGFLVRSRPVPLIFVTAYADQPTFERAREAGPFAFLSKPYDELLLARTIDLAVRNFQSATPPPVVAIGGAADGWLSAEVLYLREHNRHVRVVLREVVRIEADNQYVHLHTTGPKYTQRTTLRELEEQLPTDQFVRVHRSWLVRLGAIEEVAYTEGVLRVGGVVVPLARSCRNELRQRLSPRTFSAT